MALLSGEAIEARNILANAVAQSFRNASYDLRIDKIITPGAEETIDFILPAQGMVEVISAERVQLPADVAGYALVKTSLCNQGILALNIGILDPGYSGRISSTLINFGKTDFALRQGDTFLRLTFHEYEAQEQIRYVTFDDPAYFADKKEKVLKYFSERFLDIKRTVEEVTEPVSKRVVEEWRTQLLKWVPAVAFSVAGLGLLLATLGFFVNWGATWSARSMLLNKDQLKNEVIADLRSADVKDLKERLEKLESALKSPPPMKPPPAAGATAPRPAPGAGSPMRRP